VPPSEVSFGSSCVTYARANHTRLVPACTVLSISAHISARISDLAHISAHILLDVDDPQFVRQLVGQLLRAGHLLAVGRDHEPPLDLRRRERRVVGRAEPDLGIAEGRGSARAVLASGSRAHLGHISRDLRVDLVAVLARHRRHQLRVRRADETLEPAEE